MNETPSELQVRLLQETRCAETFLKVPLAGFSRALVFFDYGEGKSVSYKSSYRRGAMTAAFQRLLSSWETGAVRAGTEHLTPTPNAFMAAVEVVRAEAERYGSGWALLAGDAPIYAAGADREDMARTLRDMLPLWKADGL